MYLEGIRHYSISGQEFDVTGGDLIAYYESEDFVISDKSERCVFYSAAFLAPDLLPLLPMESRVIRVTPRIHRNFKLLYEASISSDTIIRKLKMYSALCKLLVSIETVSGNSKTLTQSGSQWWHVEEHVRRHLLFRATLDQLAEIGNCSRTQVVRLCRKVTDMSPMQRLRMLRMEEARMLRLYSNMGISQIAAYLGYPRVHEFSREFSRYFKIPPSKMRFDS